MQDDILRIPDDVWENRCQWCGHRTAEKNRDVIRRELDTSRQEVMKTIPCRIMRLARYEDIPGECGSFAPNFIYGICATCEHDNMFHEGYCTAENQPDKRQVYVGQGYMDVNYWGIHRLSTCGNYKPDPNDIDIMRKQAARGLIPKNFDPETMKPITTTGRNETAEHWAKVEQDLAAEDRQVKADLEAIRARLENQIPGQVSFADIMQEAR